MLCLVALIRIDVAEEISSSIISGTRIGELGKLVVNSHTAQHPRTRQSS
jgi:hypothetical protein